MVASVALVKHAALRVRAAFAPHALLLLLLISVFWVYYPTLHTPLHGDDYFAFVDVSAKPFDRFVSDVIHHRDSNVAWRPLEQVYFYVSYQVFGLDSTFYHATNLAVFLATVAALYALCLAFGLGRLTAILAAAILGLFPNHPVTVAWVTTGARLFAVLYLLLGLLVLLYAIDRRKRALEAGAQALFALAYVSDEVSVMLAPVPVMVALVADPGREGLRRNVVRACVGALPAATVGLYQLGAPLNGTPFEPDLGLGSLERIWGLTGRLLYPVTGPVWLNTMPPELWVAGAAGLGLGVVLLLGGSRRLKVLVCWVLLAMAPFCLTIPIAPPRYIYMASVPASALAGWVLATVTTQAAARAQASQQARLPRLLRYAAMPALAVSLMAAALVLGPVTQHKNSIFAEDTKKFTLLAERLPEVLPRVDPGTTIVIYYGIWDDPFGFSSAVVRAVYGDPTISVASIPRGLVLESRPPYPKERRVYFTGEDFIAAPPPGVQAR